MTHAMTRRLLSASTVFVALAGWGLFGPGAATAAPAPKPPTPAGSYYGPVPGSYYSDVHQDAWQALTVKNGGKVAGALVGQGSGSTDQTPYGPGELSGQVDRNGRLSAHVVETYYVGIGHIPVTHEFDIAGSVSLDGAGNIVGTTIDDVAFTWIRR
jgi:hypothetical protein